MDILISEKFDISARIINVGDDICIILSGGDAPHIGAVSCGINSAGVGASHPDKVDITEAGRIQTIKFPAHEDAALSVPLAKNLSEKLKRNVIVLCGIHIDDISKKEIEEIVALMPVIEQKIVDAVII